MKSRELIYAACENKEVDRIPLIFWRHFPSDELSISNFAKAIIKFQNKFDFDMVKVTSASNLITEAWGGKLIYRDDKEGSCIGTRKVLDYPVKNYKDWKKIKKLDISQTLLQKELDAIKIIRENIDNSIPVVCTIPNSLTVAKMLSGELWLKDMKEHAEEFHRGLVIITEVIIDFIKLYMKSGAESVFFYTHAATNILLTEKEYKTFGIKYDLQIFSEVKNYVDLFIFHMHGSDIMFDLLKDYPVQVINWHDRTTKPSLKDAKKVFQGAVLGGIDEHNILMKRNVDDIKKQVRDTIQQTNGRGLIIGPGCVLPVNTPVKNILAVKEAIAEYQN